MIQSIPIRDGETAFVALAAMISPAWAPFLNEISTIAVPILQVLGGVWLAVQIAAKIKITWFPDE